MLGFYFNQDACIGCKACWVACKDRNDLDVGIAYRRVNSYQVGAYPTARIVHYSGACSHCAAAACVENCPTGAMFKAADGTTQHSDSACIGCQTCVNVCPYGAPVLVPEKGIVGKCDSCKPFRDAGLNPVCVDACTMRALDFGELDALREKHGEGLVRSVLNMPGEDETEPGLLISPKIIARNAELREVLL